MIHVEDIKGQKIYVAYGGGTNSTALIIRLIKMELSIEMIAFADTGGEKQFTYDYVSMFSEWVFDKIGKEIITVYPTTKDGERNNLYDDCMSRKALPSLAYGWKTCSDRYKARPQNKYLKTYEPFQEIWEKDGKIIKMLGFDADEERRVKRSIDKKYLNCFPLVDLGMDRGDCVNEIESVGLSLPGKSSCFFCPAMKKHEINALPVEYLEKAFEMERNADLKSIKGLGRYFSWEDYVSHGKQLTFSDIDISCDCYDG